VRRTHLAGGDDDVGLLGRVVNFDQTTGTQVLALLHLAQDGLHAGSCLLRNNEGAADHWRDPLWVGACTTRIAARATWVRGRMGAAKEGHRKVTRIIYGEAER
jgi:hypothetical protein